MTDSGDWTNRLDSKSIYPKLQWQGDRWICCSAVLMGLCCDSAALWMVRPFHPSVYLCVCLSACLSVSLSHLFGNVPVIESSWNFQWCPCKSQGQGSKVVKVTEVQTLFSSFRTITPVWINIWQKIMQKKHMRGRFFRGHPSISTSYGTKNLDFDPDWPFPDCNYSLNSHEATKWCATLEVA